MANRARDWFEQAASDLAFAREARDSGRFEWACFVAQQAAEKAVKAAFQHIGGNAWGHSIADLLAVLAREHADAGDYRTSALELDKAYIPTRYPDAHPSGAPHNRYTTEEADRLIQHADRIIRYCEGLLSEPRSEDDN